MDSSLKYLVNSSMRFFYIFLFGVSNTFFPQKVLNLPLKIPISLSGNFGELRTTHFHMGLDFKTDGEENIPVYAVEEGFVSRISVSARGYGKALYIDHPKHGITTVYAHLNSFSPKIQHICDSMQFLYRSNTIDFTLNKEITVKKEEQIALSGNTGGSEGPHLHFEIRDLISERTLNPMMFYDIKDDSRPVISSLILYRMSPYGAEFLKQIELSDVENKTIEIDEPNIGIGIEAFDKGSNSNNLLGLYKVDLYEKNDWIYSCVFDTLDFEKQPMVKLVDDPFLHRNKGSIYKLFDERCVSPFVNNKTNGHLVFGTGDTKNIEIELQDINGNKTTLKFKLSLSKSNQEQILDRKNVLFCDIKNELYLKKMCVKFDFPVFCFPYSVNISIDKNFKSKKNDVSSRFKVGHEHIPVIKPYTIYFEKIEVPNTMIDKVYLENIVKNKTKNYKLEYTQEGYRASKVTSFGEMSLVIDFEPPFVISNNLNNHDPKKEFEFKVDDEQSGLKKYQLIVDSEWEKIYYDEKNKTLIYNPLKKGKEKKHIAILDLEDMVGNKKSIAYELFY